MKNMPSAEQLIKVSGRENVVFFSGRKKYCTCGYAFETPGLTCPKCKTKHRERFTNSNLKRAVHITGLIYFDIEDVEEKSFTLKRYDLIYKIDQEKKKVDAFVREYGSLDYHYDKKEFYCNIYRDKKSHPPKHLLKYRDRYFTKINDNNIKEKISKCVYFYERTGFKELDDIYRNHYGMRWGGVEELIDFIEYYHVHGNREIELIAKAGFTRASADVFRSKTSLRKGTRLGDVIKLPKSVIKLIKDDCDYKQIKALEFLHEKGGGLTPEKIAFMERLDGYHRRLHLLPQIKELVNQGYKLTELFNYLERADVYQAIEPAAALMILSDYVNMAAASEVPYDKFPNSLKKAHDLMLRRYKYIENEVYSKQVLKKIKENKHLSYEGEEYSIILPKDTADLVREGNTLHHCVASYIKRISIGVSFIVFLRKTIDKDKPFYTIEIRDDRVVQVRGYANKKLANPKAKEFLKHWGRKNNIDIVTI